MVSTVKEEGVGSQSRQDQ